MVKMKTEYCPAVYEFGVKNFSGEIISTKFAPDIYYAEDRWIKEKFEFPKNCMIVTLRKVEAYQVEHFFKKEI